jgi:hypothetical protein
MPNQIVTRVLGIKTAPHREPLTRRATEDDIHLPGPFRGPRQSRQASTGSNAQVRLIRARGIPAHYLAPRKVVAMGGCVGRIVFKGSNDIEPGLLEAERHTPSAREEVYRDRTLLS